MGDMVAPGKPCRFPIPQMDQLPQCLNLMVRSVSPHCLLTLAALGTFIANWKNLLSAAFAVWWLEHSFHNSTVRSFKDTGISNSKTKQAGGVYYGSGLVNRGKTNRISTFCLYIVLSVGSVSLCQFAIS